MLFTLVRLLFIPVGTIAALRAKGLLRLYLVLATFSVAALELAFWYEKPFYTLIYVLVRVPECVAMLWLAHPRKAALFGTAGLVIMALLGLQATPLPGIYVCLAEGGIFAFCGLSLGLRAKSVTDGTLAVLWLLLAAFDFAWAIGWELPGYKELNQWWPTALCIGAFGLIALLSRPVRPRGLSLSTGASSRT